MAKTCEAQCEHQRSGLADLARILERVVGIRERSVGIAKQPQSSRPITQGYNPDVCAKTRRQRTMLGGIVERDSAVEMRSPLRDVSCKQQGHTQDAMCYQERSRRSSASACSMHKRARSVAALVSGAAHPLTWMSGVMSAT
jgi:hypothetical protein